MERSWWPAWQATRYSPRGRRSGCSARATNTRQGRVRPRRSRGPVTSDEMGQLGAVPAVLRWPGLVPDQITVFCSVGLARTEVAVVLSKPGTPNTY